MCMRLQAYQEAGSGLYHCSAFYPFRYHYQSSFVLTDEQKECCLELGMAARLQNRAVNLEIEKAPLGFPYGHVQQ